METYKLFSRYVIETFLTDDKKGEFASLVIDEQFMKGAANESNATLGDFIKNLRVELFHRYNNTSFNDINIHTDLSISTKSQSPDC